MARVELRGVTKSFPVGRKVTQVLHGVDIVAGSGEFLVLLGPSGCGKSTSLRIIAGLEDADGGDVFIDGERVNHVPAAERGIAMVFQNYALYPHLDVLDNIVFGLRVRRTGKAERRRRALEAAELLGLADHLDRRPAELSGGQRQRVALGRALVSDANVVLMDEPLSNLDAKLRAEMRVELRGLQRRLGLTVVYVTHDQVEAMTMADRVVVMREGRIEQDATPIDLYREPATAAVARFIGSPAMNLLPGRVTDDTLEIHLPEQRVAMPASSDQGASARVEVGIRPEDLRLDGTGDAQLHGTVVATELLGAESLVSVDVGHEHALVARAQGIVAAAEGEDVDVGLRLRDLRVFSGVDGRRLSLTPTPTTTPRSPSPTTPT